MTKHIVEDFPVDIVYLWCDSNDIEWEKKRSAELSKYTGADIDADAVDKCRFISNDELRYSLRSLEKYAPWLNNIYIVTDNQIPEWLDTDNPKIKLINHSQILPPEVLPTFNASAIETAICNIPGLSEHFLFANDDMFFGQPVDKSFFYDKNGNPVFRFSKRKIINKKYKHLFGYMVSAAYKLVKDNIGPSFAHFPHHNIDAYRKSAMKDCIRFFESGFRNTASQKFREKDCIQRSVFGYYSIAKGEGCAVVADDIRLRLKAVLFHTNLDSIQIPLSEKKFYMLDKYRPALFCINDSIKSTDVDRLALRSFLERKFPLPSKFEKKSDKTADVMVCTHKKFDKLENEILKPIQAGSESSSEDLGILKDNTGDNISGKNKYFSELTVLYWLWKNSSADYKGLVHYRRFFDLGNGSIRWIDKIPQNYTQMFCLSKSYLEHILSDYDIILPMKRVIPKYKSIYDQYKNRHVISDLDRVMEIIKEKYPQMYDTAVYVMKNTKEIYLYNMFITKKSIFDDYAKWLFDILFALEKEIQPEVETRSEYQKRVYGFLSERLFTVYLQYLKMQGIKMIELPVIYCETNKNRFNIVKFRTKIYKLLTAAGIRRPHWKEQYGV